MYNPSILLTANEVKLNQQNNLELLLEGENVRDVMKKFSGHLIFHDYRYLD